MRTNSNAFKVLKYMYDNKMDGTTDSYEHAKNYINLYNKYGFTFTQIENAIAHLMRCNYIESFRSLADMREAVYVITENGIEVIKNSCPEQPKKIEEPQPKQIEEDFSYVKNMKNYKFLFVKLLDMIISTPEFKNDVHLIVKILTDLKNDGWFTETPDGRFPICEDAIKGYTQFMNEEGRAIINEESTTPSNEIPCEKANETDYEIAMKLCETAMKLCKEATNMCHKASYM